MDDINKQNNYNVFLSKIGITMVQLIFSTWHICGSRLVKDANISPMNFTLSRQTFSLITILIIIKIIEYNNKNKIKKINTINNNNNNITPKKINNDNNNKLKLTSSSSPKNKNNSNNNNNNNNNNINKNKNKNNININNNTNNTNNNEIKQNDDLTGFKSTEDLIKMCLCGLFGGAFMPMLYLYGLTLTSPTVTSLYDGPLLPILVFIITALLGIEKLAKSNKSKLKQISSICLSVFCAITVLIADSNDISNNDGLSTDQFVIGNSILFLMVSSYAAMAILQKKLKRYPPLTISFYIFLIGSVVDSIIVSVLQKGGIIYAFIEVYTACSNSKLFMFGLMYSVIFLTVINFTIMSFAAKYLPSTTITLYSCAQPAITCVLEFLINSKPIKPIQIIAIIGIGIGMNMFINSKKILSQSKSIPTTV